MKTKDNGNRPALVTFTAILSERMDGSLFNPKPEELESIMGDVRRELLVRFPHMKCEYNYADLIHSIEITVSTDVGEDADGDVEWMNHEVSAAADRAGRRHGVWAEVLQCEFTFATVRDHPNAKGSHVREVSYHEMTRMTRKLAKLNQGEDH